MATNNSQIQLARKEIVALLERQKAQITMALPKHLTADRLCRIAVTEMSKNPKLYECTPTSILASVIVAAQLGLEIGVNGQAFLVPYKGVCQLIPGWQGFVDLISRSGRASVWTGAVRDGDEFEYTLGSNPVLKHTPGDSDGGDFTHVYGVGWVRGAQWPVIEVWSRNKVTKHLKTYNKVGDRHYALQGENNLEMYGRKVALMQVMKYMPKSIELVQAQTLEYRGSEGLQNLTISAGGVADAEYVDLGLTVDSSSSAQTVNISPQAAEITELLEARGMNKAQINMTLAKHAGKLPELLEKIKSEQDPTTTKGGLGNTATSNATEAVTPSSTRVSGTQSGTESGPKPRSTKPQEGFSF